MIRPIVKDVLFLRQKSEPAGKGDLRVGIDLADTLEAYRGECVGMAANMIGVKKRVIIISTAEADIVMYNPVILRKEQKYETEEGCLSLDGVRKTERYRKVTVEYMDQRWKKKTGTFVGFPAQVLQHEMDHLEGILI